MTSVFITHHPDALRDYFGMDLVERLRQHCDVRINPFHRTLEVSELIELAQGCAIIISDRRTAAPATVFESLPALKAFQRVAVDIRNIDVAAASKAGVLVTRSSPGFDAAVSEWIVAAMLDLSRGISSYVAAYRSQPAAPPMRIGRQLRGSTLGIIGYGTIGQYLAQLGVALGMKVSITDPRVAPLSADIARVEFSDLLETSDFLVCLAPALPQTRHLMNAASFARMRPAAYFINASRNELVDEEALWQALENRTIAAAALDVGSEADQKPSRKLAARPDVIATPHIAGHTPEAIRHLAGFAVEQTLDLLSGKLPANLVNTLAPHL